MERPADRRISNVGIVDDDVFVSLQPAEAAMNAAARMAGIVFDEYTRSGLQLHPEASKTAVLFGWIGPGSDEAHRACDAMVEAREGIPFVTRGVEHILPVTKSYKHVGGGYPGQTTKYARTSS